MRPPCNRRVAAAQPPRSHCTPRRVTAASHPPPPPPPSHTQELAHNPHATEPGYSSAAEQGRDLGHDVAWLHNSAVHRLPSSHSLRAALEGWTAANGGDATEWELAQVVHCVTAM